MQILINDNIDQTAQAKMPLFLVQILHQCNSDVKATSTSASTPPPHKT